MPKKTNVTKARMTNTPRAKGRLFPRRRRFVAVADIPIFALKLFSSHSTAEWNELWLVIQGLYAIPDKFGLEY